MTGSLWPKNGMRIEVAEYIQLVLCFLLKASFVTGTTTIRSRLSKSWQHQRRRQVTIKQYGGIHFRSK